LTVCGKAYRNLTSPRLPVVSLYVGDVENCVLIVRGVIVDSEGDVLAAASREAAGVVKRTKV
jgi:hypothetical protein